MGKKKPELKTNRPNQWKKKKKKKKKNNQTANLGGKKKEKKKKKKRDWIANPEKKEKKKVKGQKLRLSTVCGSPMCVNYNITIELWVMETENTFCYGNKVIICQTTFLLWVLSFLSYELWKLRIAL